jgi:hypothetical protein
MTVWSRRQATQQDGARNIVVEVTNAAACDHGDRQIEIFSIRCE